MTFYRTFLNKFKVIGLLIGERETIPRFVQDFWNEQNLNKLSLFLLGPITVQHSITTNFKIGMKI